MGRGRAKAKQTKVARDLKYRSHETDFGALARELHGDERDEGIDGKVDDADDLAAAAARSTSTTTGPTTPSPPAGTDRLLAGPAGRH